MMHKKLGCKRLGRTTYGYKSMQFPRLPIHFRPKMKVLPFLSLLSYAFCAATCYKKKEAVKYIAQEFVPNNGNTPKANIAIGTPPQNVTVILDTGSATAFVPGSMIGYPDNVQNSVYNASESSSITTTDKTPSGYWNKPTTADFRWFVFDKTYWGEGKGAAAFNTSFVMQTTFQTPIFGLDIRSANQKPYGAVMLMMQMAGVIRNLTFALSYHTADFDDFSGTFMFGAIDHSKYLGKLTAVPINDGRVTVDNYEYYEEGDAKSGYTEADPHKLPFINGTTTMFDSGGIKTFILQDAFTEIENILGAQNGKFNSTVIRERKPVIVYSLAGGTFTFKIRLADRIMNEGLFGSFKGISPTTSKTKAMGPAFFKQVYTVWDYENKRMLFAERNPNPGTPDIRYLTEDDIEN